MRVFLDTNILLDVVERRHPFLESSQRVLDRCDLLGFEIFVAGHGLATLFYVVERKVGRESALAMIRRVLGFARVAPLGDSEARNALSFGIEDYEDALQVASAVSCAADWIISRDALGFTGSPVPRLSPEEFLKRFPVSAGP